MEDIRIFAILMGIPEALVTVLFLKECLGVKMGNEKLGLLVGIILSWIGYGYFYDNFLVYSIFLLAIMVPYCRIVMNGNVLRQECIVVGMIFLSGLFRFGSSILVKSIICVFGWEQLEHFVGGILIFYLQKVLYITALCILMTFIRKDYKDMHMERGCSIGYGIGNVLLIMLFLIWNAKVSIGGKECEYVGWILLTGQIVTLLLLGAVFRVKNSDKVLLENVLLNDRMRQQQMNILRIEEDYYNARKMRHDIKRSYGIYLRLLEEGNSDKVKELIQEQMGNFTESQVVFFDGNSMINAVLNEKRTLCLKEDVELSIQWIVKITGEIEMDVAVLLSNLLDNAMEAQRKRSVGRKIFVNIFEQSGMYNFVIKNPIDESVLAKNPRLDSEKDNLFWHGIGLKSVRDTVLKYDGIIDFEEADGKFIVHVAIPM